MYVCMCVCVYVCMCVYVYMYIYVYICIYGLCLEVGLSALKYMAFPLKYVKIAQYYLHVTFLVLKMA